MYIRTYVAIFKYGISVITKFVHNLMDNDNEKIYYARNYGLSFKLYGLQISTNKTPVIDLSVKDT